MEIMKSFVDFVGENPLFLFLQAQWAARNNYFMRKFLLNPAALRWIRERNPSPMFIVRTLFLVFSLSVWVSNFYILFLSLLLIIYLEYLYWLKLRSTITRKWAWGHRYELATLSILVILHFLLPYFSIPSPLLAVVDLLFSFVNSFVHYMKKGENMSPSPSQGQKPNNENPKPAPESNNVVEEEKGESSPQNEDGGVNLNFNKTQSPMKVRAKSSPLREVIIPKTKKGSPKSLKSPHKSPGETNAFGSDNIFTIQDSIRHQLRSDVNEFQSREVQLRHTGVAGGALLRVAQAQFNSKWNSGCDAVANDRKRRASGEVTYFQETLHDFTQQCKKSSPKVSRSVVEGGVGGGIFAVAIEKMIEQAKKNKKE